MSVTHIHTCHSRVNSHEAYLIPFVLTPLSSDSRSNFAAVSDLPELTRSTISYTLPHRVGSLELHISHAYARTHAQENSSAVCTLRNPQAYSRRYSSSTTSKKQVNVLTPLLVYGRTCDTLVRLPSPQPCSCAHRLVGGTHPPCSCTHTYRLLTVHPHTLPLGCAPASARIASWLCTSIRTHCLLAVHRHPHALPLDCAPASARIAS